MLPLAIGDVSGLFRFCSRLVREFGKYSSEPEFCRLQGLAEILGNYEVYLQTQQYIMLLYGIIQIIIPE